MNKAVDDKKWMFPDVSYLAEDSIGNIMLREQLQLLHAQILDLTHKLTEKETETTELSSLSNNLQNQVQNLQESNSKLINNINTMLCQMNDSQTTQSIEIIKKITKKIIQDEMKKDINILPAMIETIFKKINSELNVIVEISSQDYRLIQNTMPNEKYELKENKLLEGGDIVITSDNAGLMFKLEDAISTLLGR